MFVIQNGKVAVRWTENNGEIRGKDIDISNVELFEKYSIMEYIIKCVNKITIRYIFFVLFPSLSLNGIYNSYIIILSE